MYRFIFLLFLIPIFSQAEINWFLSKKESRHKWALIPVYNRSGSLGHVIGSRIFIYPVQKNGLYLSGSMDWKPQMENFLGYRTHLYYWTKSGSELEINFEHESLFDSFYKYNNFTINEEVLDRHHRVEVPSQNSIGFIQYLVPWKEYFSIGGFLDFYYRKELETPCFLVREETQKMDENCLGFQKESIVSSIGAIARRDTRDKKFNPLRGHFLKATAKVSYDFINQVETFFQTEIKSLFIYPFLDNERWVLNFLLGWSYHPENTSRIPYSSQFKLGGVDHLRGYRHGRFFSGEYYLIQNELRIPHSHWFQSVFFIDIGEIELFASPYVTFGFGFHIGLPPQYNQRIRFEWGFGRGQKNFIVAFALPY